MYLQYFNLIEKPFQISPDPRFLWLGEKHKEAFANLLYSMIDQNGFLVLTGDVGSGKTTLLNALLENIGSDVLAATISNPRMEVLEMLRYIAKSYDPDARCESKTEFILQMSQRFREIEAQGKKLLLVIDEAHLLSADQLEEIRLISNIESSQKKLITIILIGQNELNQMLSSDPCRALRQRITLYYQLQPFTLEETDQYIKHRLMVAGTEEPIFTAAAIGEIQKLTGGLPRLINTLGARALLTGYAKGIRSIGREVIRECGLELHLPDQEPELPRLSPIRTAPRNRTATLAAAGLAALSIPALALVGVKVFMERPASRTELVTASVAGQNSTPEPDRGSTAAAETIAVGGGDPLPAESRGPHPEAAAFAPESGTQSAHQDRSISASGQKVEPAQTSPEKTTQTSGDGPPGHTQPPDRKRTEAPPETAVLKAAELPRPPAPSPDAGPAIRIEAQNALEKQNYRLAIEVLESYLSQQSEVPAPFKHIYAQALTGQGRLYLEAKRYKEAEASLVKAASNAPGDFETHFELGKLYTKTQEYAKAVESYKRAIEVKPDSAAGLYNLGFVYAGQNDMANAEKMLLRAVEHEAPFRDKIYFNLGVVQLKLGKKNDGILNLKKSLSVNPANLRAQEYLARLGE